jgi:hypothetical protein
LRGRAVGTKARGDGGERRCAAALAMGAVLAVALVVVLVLGFAAAFAVWVKN